MRPLLPSRILLGWFSACVFAAVAPDCGSAKSVTDPSMRRWKGKVVGFATAALLTATVGPDARAQDQEIAQRGIRFTQQAVTIKVGDTLHFRNRDPVMHNLVVRDSWDNLENEGLQKSGTLLSKTFTEVGLFEIRCAIHPRMKMSVSVAK